MVRVKIKPDGVKNFEAASGLAVTATRKEKGNVAYELRRDLEEAGTYFFVEKWRSSAALEEHLKSEYIKTLLATLDEVATEAPSARFTTAPAKEAK